MWARFTERARQTVYAAQERARSLGLREVTTEHLLMGLVDDLTNAIEPNKAVQVLETLGVDRKAILTALTAHADEIASPETPIIAEMQLSERAKRVIDLSFDEARMLDNNYIGTEHILLGILREPEGLGGATLRRLGITLEGAQAWLGVQKSEAGGDVKPDTVFTKAVASLRGLLRVPPAPLGREPIPNPTAQPILALDLTPENAERFANAIQRSDGKAIAESLREQVELPPDTLVEVLPDPEISVPGWRLIRVQGGDHHGRLLFVPAPYIVAEEANKTDADAPENHPRQFEWLLRAALTVNSDSFDLTAGSPLILKNILTEDEIHALVDEIITPQQREAIERGEVAEAWCAVLPGDGRERIEFNVDVYKIRGRLTARFMRAGR